MSQQGQTIVSLQVGVKGRKLSDVEVLSIKEFDGKRRFDEGVLNNGATGALATLTATVGKDMYVAKAKFSWELSAGSNELINVELRLNGVVVESFSGRVNVGDALSYEFVNMGGKVLAGETIEVFVATSDPGLDFEGVLVCFEENTGESPQIPSI